MSSEDLIREANDPATAPARLAELASADRATWPALAGNPSTYDALLTWLGERNDPGVNAALAARAQAALPPVPPAPAPPAPAAPPAAADQTPTVVSPAAPVAPAAPAFEAPAQAEPAAASEPTAAFTAPVAEPTAVFQAPASPEPTAVFQTPASPEPTATYPAAPVTTETPAAPADGNNGGKNLAIVIAMVAVVIALIAGAAYGATQLFGDDDDPVSASTNDSKKTDDASDDKDEDEDEDIPSIAPPSLDSDDTDLSGSSDEFCSTMKSVQDASQDLVSRSSSSPDLDDLKEMGEDMAKAYDDLADTAPAELRPDIEAMGGYFELMTNPTADGASKMSETFSDYMDSAQKVSTYYAQNCF